MVCLVRLTRVMRLARRPCSKAFTLIELLVVIAIIAILAAILFPVFAQAKEVAKKSKSLSQMRQLALSVMMYAGDQDDQFVPASMRSANPNDVPIIWTQGLAAYIKNKDILIPDGSEAGYSSNWDERRHQGVGYSDATGYDPLSTAVPGNAAPGTGGFTRALRLGGMEGAAHSGPFTLTAHARKGDVTTKHRGYVFNPYNGMNDPDGVYAKGLPLISDRDLVVERGDANYPNSPDLSPGRLKPVWARLGADKKNGGQTPVIFGDGHAKVMSAKQMNQFGAVIWRFR